MPAAAAPHKNNLKRGRDVPYYDGATQHFGADAPAGDRGRARMATKVKKPATADAALTDGLEAIGKEVMGYARNSFENAAETATALLGAKTFEDVVQLNTDFAKASFERMIEGSTKLSEMGVKVANEALAPLGDRVEATFQKLGKPLAA